MFKLPNNSAQTLTIWDSDSICILKPEQLVLWRQFVDSSHDKTTVSICELIELNSTNLRARLLRFIYDVGTSITANSKTNHEFRSGFDYFWMTQFHSRPYTPSAQLNNLAKVFTLIELVQEKKTKKLVIHSDNKALTQVLSSVAASLHIDLKVIRVKPTFKRAPIRTQVKTRVPRPLLAILAFITQVKTSMSLGSKQLNATHSNSISFFDYWYRFAESVGDDRKFGSQYWSGLVTQLEGTKVNWWHNLVDQNTFSELKDAKNLLKSFNQQSNHYHEIIDSRISLKILFMTIFDHGKLVLSSIPGRRYKTAFTDPETKVNFWPLLKQEWLNSMRGYEALINCLRFNRLESLISAMPRQKMGVYLAENQPWEMSLIYLWRKHNHEKLIGVAHSTIRHWDLRLMSDTKQFSSQSKMPRPDCIAVNGELAKKSLLDAGYPESEVVEVEALMYLHLGTKKIQPKRNQPLTILVATDYLESATKAQMHLLEELVATDPTKYRILLKPHWSQSLDSLRFDAEIVSGKKDLAQFFEHVDVLYCSAITSAVIDGVCAGLPVIQCLDPMSFNLSPLRESDSVQLVRTCAELATALAQIDRFVPNVGPSDFFNLDRSLPKWKNLLQI